MAAHAVDDRKKSELRLRDELIFVDAANQAGIGRGGESKLHDRGLVRLPAPAASCNTVCYVLGP